MQSEHGYWFPTKRYGWGWGFPVAWQGWVVFALFLILVVAGALLFGAFDLSTALTAYLAYLCVLCAQFIGICWWKGEPPRWRWG
jgi:hypothetical protein